MTDEFVQRLLKDPEALLRASEKEESAVKYFERCRWPSRKPRCHRCGGIDTYRPGSIRGRAELLIRRDVMCRTCSKKFTVRQGTFLEGSNSSLRYWGLAIAGAVLDPENIRSNIEIAGGALVTAKKIEKVAIDLVIGGVTGAEDKVPEEKKVVEPEASPPVPAPVPSLVPEPSNSSRLRSLATKVGLAIALAFVAWSAAMQWEARAHEPTSAAASAQPAPALFSIWEHNGETKRISTAPRDEWTKAEHHFRHWEAVKLAQSRWPATN